MKSQFFKILMMLFVALPSVAFAQIRGLVLDKSTGEPVTGANVVVKGTTKGTVTDVDGKFYLDINKESLLNVSFIGYASVEQRVYPGKNATIYLSSQLQEMEEVVVVGASMKKSDLTGSVQRISADDMKDVPTSDLNQALQGKVPGVFVSSTSRPGEAASIKIRGNNSISYGTNPIYVVDGLVMENGYDMINPNDIAYIDILKDASATAIYGARGANGVILITTKKGKSKKGQVSYDGWVGFQDFSKTIPTLNGQQIFDLRAESYVNSELRYKHPDWSEERIQQQAEKLYYNTDYRRNLAFSERELNSYNAGVDYDWVDLVTQPGFQQNHNLSFQKASETGSVYVSFGYNKQKGQVIETGYNRYTGKVNLEEKIKPWLKIGTNNAFAYAEKQPTKEDIYYTALMACPLLEPSEEYTYMQAGRVENQSSTNPLLTKYIDRDYYSSRLTSSSYLNITPLKGLDVRSTFSLNFDNYEDYSYYGTESANSINKGLDGNAIQKKGKNINWTWDNTVQYNTVFKDKHKFSALYAMSYTRELGNYNNINVQGFGNDLFGYHNIGGAADKENASYGSDFWASTLASYMLRFNYSYNGRYYITLTGRMDGSSKFGPNHKWGFFPSTAVSWNLTNEEFMRRMVEAGINNLRVRLGYGIAGNQNIGRYKYYTIYNPSISLDDIILSNGGEYGNPDLRWEQQKQVNVGLDFGAFNDRIKFALDYFHINNDNLLMMRGMAASSGYLQKMDNVGCMTNKGIEFALSFTPIQTKDWNWNVGFNIAHDKNKITKLYDDVTYIYNLGGYSNNEIQREGNLFIGESINNYYLYEFDHIIQNTPEDLALAEKYSKSTGKIIQAGDILPKDRNNDGMIDDDDRFVAGSSDPNFYGSLSTNLSWKGISLDIFCTFSQGAKKVSPIYENLMRTSGTPVCAAHEDMLNRWTPENPSTTIPRAFFASGRYSVGETDLTLQDASFFRLSNVTLSYTFPAKLIKKAFMSNLRVYVSGNNLCVATKYKGYDPEMGDWYPATRMFVCGLNVSF